MTTAGRWFWVITVSLLISESIGCGGGGNSSNSQPPVFTSTAPTTASEGQAYSYTITATSPSGGTVTYSIVSGPTNASISGNVLSWTPTHAQSRMANQFTVQAMSTGGGTATQSFSVTPTGNIDGTNNLISYSEGGKQIVPATAGVVMAYIPNGSGGYTPLAGTASSGGFSIPGVPSGYYMLQVDSQFLWTSSSDVDFSTPWEGRTNATCPQQVTTLNVDITMPPPQYPNNFYYLFTPNVNQGLYDTGGGTTWNSSYLWQIWGLPDASQGDLTYTYRSQPTELANNTWTGYELTDWGTPTGLTIPDGGTVTLTGNMTAQQQTGSVEGNLNVSGFVSLEPSVAPNYSGMYSFRLYFQPFTADYYFYPLISGNVNYISQPNSFVLYPFTQTGSDIDLGSVPYANPFPSSWVPYAGFQIIGNLPYTADGATQPWNFVGGVGTLSTTMPTQGSPIAPLVGQATNITINGQNFYSDQPSAGAEPTISWSAPTTGQADGYYLVVYQLQNVGGGTAPAEMFVFATKQTQIVLPPGILQAGYDYVFLLTAFKGNANVEQGPFYSSFPWGYADAFSGNIHVDSSGSSPGHLHPAWQAPCGYQQQNPPAMKSQSKGPHSFL